MNPGASCAAAAYEETPTAAPTTVTPSSYSYTYKEAPTAAPTTETGSPTSL